MDDALTCEICTEKFSSPHRDPLVLLCGHTFCRTCMINISNEDPDFLCPSCRRTQEYVDVESLPVNYKLLGFPMTPAELKYDTCAEHGDELTYWCKTCQSPLCGLCLFRNHPQEHEVGKAKDILQEKNQQLESKVQKWKGDIEASNGVILQRILKELRTLCTNKTQFSKTKKVVDELLEEVTKDFSLVTITDIETKINSLMLNAEVSGNTAGPSNSNGCGAEAQTPQRNGAQASGVSYVKELFCCVQNPDGKNATVQWQDGKILMSSFSDYPIACDLVLKMPSEVFLELSINSKNIGRVIIKPWYQLRRAQQFAALCIGSFGVSYAGTAFESVMQENLPRETLVGGWYTSPPDGAITCREQMTDLEWDGSAEGEALEGVVMGILDEYDGDSKFGICTRGQRGTYFKCPFGLVVSGMDVVKAAVRHFPVSEVTITRCGLVIPDLAL